MMQRLFFDRVDAEPARPSIRRQDHLILLPGTNKTEPLLSLLQFAIARTEVALDAPIIERMPIFRWDDRGRFRHCRKKLSCDHHEVRALYQVIGIDAGPRSKSLLHAMLTIDGSRYSGSGTIVRQAVAFSALTGQAIRMVKARAKRDKPGLRLQHIRVIQAIAELVNGQVEGLSQSSQEFTFRPGPLQTGHHYHWDIGSAGSTTMLALGVLPVLAFAESPVSVELQGGLFQDFAPSAFHLQHVLLPLLDSMGCHAELQIERPGYVPRGQGILHLRVTPVTSSFRPLMREEAGDVTRIWGIALSSHLEERRVSERMADAAQGVLGTTGYQAEIQLRHDTLSLQRGAALALFADEGTGVRLGTDQAGALRRTAESIGKHAAKQLLQEIQSGATLDRFASDQIIPFAALADGESRCKIPFTTDHVLTSAWMAELFLEARVKIEGQRMVIHGSGLRRGKQG